MGRRRVGAQVEGQCRSSGRSSRSNIDLKIDSQKSRIPGESDFTKGRKKKRSFGLFAENEAR